jgi:hypothetical protein
MRPLTLTAFVVFTLAIYPIEAPKFKGVSQSSGAQGAKHQNASRDQKQNSEHTTPSANPVVRKAPSKNPQDFTSDPNQDQQIQRKLVLYTCLLVIAGFLTAFVVGWQAWETRKAANAAKDSARAADKNIELLISKERARLRIDMEPLNLSSQQGLPRTVNFKVSIYGPTAAYIVESSCVAYVLPSDSINCEDPGSAVMLPFDSLPNVITPNSSPIEQFAFLIIEDEAALLPEIKSNRLLVGVRGFIKYRDVFDRDREIRFRYTWKYWTTGFYGDKIADFGYWEKCGAGTDNYGT